MGNRIMKRQIALLALSAALAFAASGTANAAPLSALFAGQSLAVGDTLFDRWSLVNYAASDPSRLLDAGNIEVTAFDDGGTESGLNFAISRGELTVRGDGAGAFVDLTFGFRLSMLDPAFRIGENSLGLTAGSLSYIDDRSNANGMRIRESVGRVPGFDDLGMLLAEFSLRDSVLASELGDFADFAPQSGIWITKNITVWARDASDTARLTGFSQRFSATAVPEPGTVLLVGVALAGVTLGRRTGPRPTARVRDAG